MYIFGSILVIVGVVALLDNFGFLPGNFWDFFWPALLILLGASLVARHRCRDCGSGLLSRCKCVPEKKD